MVVSVWFRCGFCLMLWVFWWFLSTRLYHYQTLPDYLFLSTQSEHDFLGSSLEMPSEAEDVDSHVTKGDENEPIVNLCQPLRSLL